jgi:hypothetical protein
MSSGPARAKNGEHAMKIDGSCHCGAITYEAEVDPERVQVCHCSDCQTLSGSAFRTVVPAIDGSFRLLSGTPTTYVKTAASGNRRAQVFCPRCGAPIFSGPADGAAGALGIRVGTIRQRDRLPPRRQQWCVSARDWVRTLATVPCVDTQ